MFRLFDFILSLVGLIFLAPLLLLITLIGLHDTGAPIFHQKRVGRYQKPFVLIKFRTMKRDTEHVATHLVNVDAVTQFGKFLRRTKLDELPQLWNILIGEMSLVGPRPCLFSQEELIAERVSRGVFEARPGLTGLAQLRRIDMSSPKLLARTDAEMLERWALSLYFKFIFLTVYGKGRGDVIKGAERNVDRQEK